MNLLVFIASPFQLIARHHQILWRTTMVEVRSVYAGSVLGMFWILLGPVLLLSLYTLVFAVIFRVRPVDMTVSEYVLYVFCGLVPFLAFSMSLTAGALSLSSHKQVLLNTVFPAELIPLRSVLVASVGLPVGTLILAGGDAIFSSLSVTWLLVPVVMVLQLMFVVGICWILSLVALLVRDIQHVLYYVTMMLLIITPIAYTPDMIPPKLKLLMYGNPLFYFVTSYQSLIILNEVPPLHIIAITIPLSLASLCIGYMAFRRAKQVFYDFA